MLLLSAGGSGRAVLSLPEPWSGVYTSPAFFGDLCVLRSVTFSFTWKLPGNENSPHSQELFPALVCCVPPTAHFHFMVSCVIM